MKALNIVLICGAAAGALGLSVACSSSTTVTGDDGGTPDSSSGDDTNNTPDNNVADNVTGDTGGDDGGTDSGGEAGCAIIGMGSGQFTSGTATCDNCVGSSCCTQATGCFAPVDGGDNPCKIFTECVLVGCQAEGGTLATCAGPCQDGGGAGGLNGAVALQTCVTNNCSAQCPGL